MIAAEKRTARAIECRRLAALSTELAEASTLDHVREKHEAAAARWLALAEADETLGEARLTQAAELQQTTEF
ncbi:hypothetical protein [Phenylobacterium immobile]|uniref:hypothetical protein n=1 Tax=Phenylobacterium immobile TaxID=21 RepID=UPI000A8D033C|nr:hypothetical protein [Phenylobacterium immobile]